jgi:hypothetical protein
MRTLLATAAVLALVGCSSAHTSTPALTDDQLAQDMTHALYGKNLQDAAAGRDAARAASVDSANSSCNLMRDGQRNGLVSTKSDDPKNAEWIQGIQVRYAQSASWTARQTLDALQISAKYKCAEFTPMLQAYEAVHGVN